MSPLFQTLKKSRKQLRISQQQLANIAKISLATLQNIESGKANPELSTLFSLFNGLGLELDIQPRPIEWQQLVALGVPLLQPDKNSSLNLMPTAPNLFTVLTRNSLALNDLALNTRKRDAIGNFLLALRDHYPSQWRLIENYFENWFKPNITFKPSPKLRRLALAKISSYL